ncbi:MAG: helix-hairpin-helix domain-containing protein [Planctomycetota bacterium]
MRHLLLRDADQRRVAGLLVLAVASMGVWWMAAGGRGRLINIERAPPRGYRFLVDVNHAAWPELAQLPAVGEVLARRIVEHRDRVGPFQTAEDLLQVSGIGDKTLAELRRYLAPLPGEQVAASDR